MKKKAIFNWSGGKDSALALYKILQEKQYHISYLATSINSESQRISMHGVSKDLLIEQANSIGIPLKTMLLPKSSEMETYEKYLFSFMSELKKESIDYSIYGDIFLEDLKTYREKQLSKVKMQAVFPLWKKDTTYLLEEFLDLGFKTIITAVDESKLDKTFSGRIIDKYFIKDLPKDVDPCGENGEFHTFVFDGPIFKNPITFDLGETVYKKYKYDKNYGFWFRNLIATKK